ncbi:conserved hypothetical protein [Thiocapsa sp. KS1]|nr:hypothetical protein [Thiocapsa sp. KS1]CRI65947.1 conserved hypothetical protein [Thiocapsa sp. KS1]
MASIVLELQRDALDRNVPITDLLRKALVVSRKLHQTSFQEWIESELNGYQGDLEIPDYREMVGQVKGWNPYHGWMPVIINEPEIMDMLSRRHSSQSISEIENLIERQESSSTLHMPFPSGQQQVLRQAVNFNTEFSLFIGRSALSRVADAVRNTVLTWALKLEDDGILGEGLSFSNSEKETAAQSNYNINNFFGEVKDTQVQQATGASNQQHANKTADVEALLALIGLLRGKIDEIDFKGDQKEEILSDLATIESQAGSPKPKQSIIRESLKSIRSILEGAGGGAVAQVLIEIGKILV